MAIEHGVSETLVHGNRKNEIRLKKIDEVRREYGKKLREHDKRSPDGLSRPNQNTTIINIIW